MRRTLLARSIDAMLLLAVLAVSLATLIALSTSDWWVGDMLSHLRIQYALALFIALVCFGARGRWVVSVFILIPMLTNLSVVLPLLTRPVEIPQAHSRAFTILHYNLDMTSTDHTLAFEYLRHSAADILLLQELTPALEDQLSQELPEYRVVYAHPLDNTHGSALLLPRKSLLQVLDVGEVHLPASSPRPLIRATLALDGQTFSLMSLHVIRPKDAYTEELQVQEYAAVSKWVVEQRQRDGAPMIVIGDYNTTPWSARFQRFLQESELRDSSMGFGYQPTWPAVAPALLAIPIDHAVTSAGIIVLNRSVGLDLGGDHRPLELEIALIRSEP